MGLKVTPERHGAELGPGGPEGEEARARPGSLKVCSPRGTMNGAGSP